MNSSPKVSVIIPMYNARKYIEECLMSVLNQILREIEVIIIDDASSDDSLKIAQRIASTDERVKVLQNSENLGSGLCRNKGMDHAAGECIYFIDADDWIEKQTLAVTYETLKKYDADFVEFGAQRVNENGVSRTFYSAPFEVITDKTRWILGYCENRYADMVFCPEYSKKNEMNEQSVNKNTERIWNKLFSANFLKLNNLRFERAVLIEDHLFVMGLCRRISKVVVISDVLYNYRLHDESLTIGAVTEDKVKGYVKVLADTKKMLEEENLLFSETGKAFMDDRIGVTTMYVWRYAERFAMQEAENLLQEAVHEVFGENYWIYTLIREMVYMYKKIADHFLDGVICSGDKIVLYGAGDIGRNLCRLLRARNIEVVAFADTNKDAWGTKYCGCEVISPEMIKELQFTKIVITVAQHKPIQMKLESMGYKRHQDYEYYPIGF